MSNMYTLRYRECTHIAKGREERVQKQRAKSLSTFTAPVGQAHRLLVYYYNKKHLVQDNLKTPLEFFLRPTVFIEIWRIATIYV